MGRSHGLLQFHGSSHGAQSFQFPAPRVLLLDQRTHGPAQAEQFAPDCAAGFSGRTGD